MEREEHGAEDDIAFDNGDNDIEMLKFAELDIVMGNAPDNVKKEADYIADRMECNGIWDALNHFRIISQ